MPIALIIIGVALAVTAFRGTYGMTTTTGGTGLAGLLVKDFSGSNNFLMWIGAIVIIGMLGYIPKMETPSRAFIALILLAMFLSNQGVFANFTSALSSASAKPPPASTEPQFAGNPTINVALGGGSGGGIGGITSGISSAANLAGSLGSLFG